MNNLQKNLNFFGTYFNGIQDILKFESSSQAALGALKIVSGFTIVLPIIFGIGFLVCQHRLENLKSLCGRVSKELNSNVGNEKLTQSDLIEFLSTRVLDQNQGDFRLAFLQLNLDSQKIFFASMANQEHLVDALNYIPNDTKEISIGIGTASAETIDKTIDMLCNFKQLLKITFDLSQTTYYTGGVKNLIQRCINIIELNSNFKSCNTSALNLNNDPVDLGGVWTYNNTMPIVRIINGVVNRLIKESPVATIDFDFKEKSSGNYRRVYIVNHSRMQKVPEGSLKKDPLNSYTYFQNQKYEDKWTAQA